MQTLMQLKYMRLEKDGKIGRVTLDRPDALNAINTEGTGELVDIARAVREDPDIRVLVIGGSGRAYCTGIDLKELAAGKIDMGYHRQFEKALRIFETMEKIVLVGMHAYCLGGGLQLALAADIRAATGDCQIGLPAIRESLIPGLSTWRLPRYVGWGRAKKMVLGGKNIDGRQALQIGLVDHLLDPQDTPGQLDELAQTYLKSCSTGMRLSKQLLNRSFDLDYDAIAADYFKLQQRAQFSPDAREAARAYLNGDEPQWQ